MTRFERGLVLLKEPKWLVVPGLDARDDMSFLALLRLGNLLVLLRRAARIHAVLRRGSLGLFLGGVLGAILLIGQPVILAATTIFVSVGVGGVCAVASVFTRSQLENAASEVVCCLLDDGGSEALASLWPTIVEQGFLDLLQEQVSCGRVVSRMRDILS